MFAMLKQAVLLYSPDRTKTFHAPNGYVGPVPEWAAQSKQGRRLIAQGAMVISNAGKDKEFSAPKTRAGSRKKEGA